MIASVRLWILIVGVLVSPIGARAAGPLIVNGAGTPLTWTTLPVPFNPDRGSLGVLANGDAVTAVEDNFAVWADVPTSNVTYAGTGQLPVDVTAANVFDFLGVCGDALSPIVFDADGSIVDEVFGPGASSSILGFAGPECITFAPPAITEGVAVLNGRFIDGIEDFDNPEISLGEFNSVFIHEFGHYSNLDHSQINLVEAFDGDSGNDDAIATMFPFIVNGVATATLALDDAVSLSTLYPEPAFAADFGTLSGTIFRLDGATPFQGAYVIARRVDDPRVTAVGVASGARFFPFTEGGPPAPELQGLYEIPGLPPGEYTIEVEEIPGFFAFGSGVGPLNPPVPLAGLPEFYNGADEAGTNPPDDPADFTTLVVAAGAVQSGVDVILNGFPPPPNDACGVPTTVPSVPFSDAVDTRGATTEASDAAQSCGSFGGNAASVWYSFTAPTDMIVTANTFGSNYDTVLSAHTGSCALLAEIGCNDDQSGLQSRLTVPLAAGETVLFQVSSFGAASDGGMLLFTVDESLPPPNDACIAATPVPVLPFTIVQDTQGASAEASDPAPSCGGPPGAASVWYTFTAAVETTLAVNTLGSDHAAVLSAYRGSCGALTEIACGAQAFPSQLSLTVAAGETVWFLVTGSGATLFFNVAPVTTYPGRAPDPSGDTIGFGGPQLDLSAMDACFGPDDVTITLAFSTPVSPFDSGAANAVGGYVDLDVDQDTATGLVPFTDFFAGRPTGLGAEYLVSLFDVDSLAGTVLVVNVVTGAAAAAPIAFDAASVTIAIPRALLGGDDGLLHAAAIVGNSSEATDVVPNDGRVATVPCGGGAGCPSAPDPACRVPLRSRRAALAIHDAADDRRDTFAWSWRAGPATTTRQFGNPRIDTGYDLCIYDRVQGTPALVTASRVPPGGLCGASRPRACWRATQQGYAYRDRQGSAAGIRGVALQAGPDGRAEITVRGRGRFLAPPALPLAQEPRVTVQLRNDAGECWGAEYSDASANTGKRFEARGD